MLRSGLKVSFCPSIEGVFCSLPAGLGSTIGGLLLACTTGGFDSVAAVLAKVVGRLAKEFAAFSTGGGGGAFFLRPAACTHHKYSS